jgi:anti-sigma B factor antagonist
MNIVSRQADGVTIVVLAGRFDAHEVAQVRGALEQAADVPAGTPARVVVNLAEVNFIDSSGLACLVQGMKRCREHKGDLFLCTLQQPVRIIFELTRLDKAFGIYASEQEAVAAFAG